MKRIEFSYASLFKGTTGVKNRFFNELIIFYSNMKQYSLGNIYVKFYGNPLHRLVQTRSTHTQIYRGLLILPLIICFYWKLFFQMASPTILKLKQCPFFPLRSESLTLQMLWIAFCDSGMLWKICVDLRK